MTSAHLLVLQLVLILASGARDNHLSRTQPFQVKRYRSESNPILLANTDASAATTTLSPADVSLLT